MTYAGQVSFKTRAASLGMVAALHGVVAVVLVTGLAAVQVIKDKPRTNAFNMPLDPPKPPKVEEAKPEAARPAEHETVIPLPLDLKPMQFDDPRPMPTDAPLPKPTETTPPLAPRAHGEFKAPVPRGRPADWATPDDYPALDLRLEHEGTARFTLAIGSDGRVNGCTITASSGWPGLDAATCALVSRHARFTPAQDEDGKATTGSYSSAIRWVIPR